MQQIPSRAKIPSKEGMLGQQGVTLIQKIVGEMKCLWAPGAPNEVGLDGTIELCDPTTGRALSKILGVQSKAVTNFLNDNADAFDFRIERRDLDYWKGGNIPVLLVVSKPDTEEVYWVAVNEYFSKPENRDTLRVRFNKRVCRFTRESIHQLLDLGVHRSASLYLAPSPKSEKLHSNLLTVESIAPKIFQAETEIRTPGELWSKLGAYTGTPTGAWLLRDKRIVSFHDLSLPPWPAVCDAHSIEEFDTGEWADSDNPDQLRQFVQLLNLTLRAEISDRVKYWHKERVFAFKGDLDHGTVKAQYDSLKQVSHISVVSKYEGISKTTQEPYRRIRHMAFEGQFKRLEGQWFLEITPTYIFTKDGHKLLFSNEAAVKKIKELEGNRAVLSQVMLWAQVLRTTGDLFDNPNRMLRFGELATFDLPVGIPDEHWKEKDENPPPDADEDGRMNLNLEKSGDGHED
jgi:hypothetical protein